MITFSGVHIQKIGGVAGTPTPADIAVHSGRICRFVWYTLLTHQIFVGMMAYHRSGSAANLIAGLIHDAHEIATADVPRPFKCDCMRVEQKALDQRIFPAFLSPEMLAEVDHDLIKECDQDACDIEAVILGVPGFAEIEMAYTTSYRGRTSVFDGKHETELLKSLLNSRFGHPSQVFGMDSQGVREYAIALQFAAAGRYDAVVNLVTNWIDA